MRFFLFFAILLITLQGCKSPEASETTPQPSVELPQSVKELVYKSYPSASNLKGLSELEKGRVYELSFEDNNVSHEAIVSKSGVLRVAATTGDPVPKSLVDKVESLTIRGGKLSNYRKVVYENEQVTYAADYELNGVKYVVRYQYVGIGLFNYLVDYPIRDIKDLPGSIQQYIAARNKPNPAFVNTLKNLNEESRQYIIKNNELAFSSCMVRLMPDGSRQYLVSVKYLGVTDLPILFNENAEVLWIGSFNRIRQFDQDFNGGLGFAAPNLTFTEITYFRDLLAGSSEFLGFDLDNFLNFNNSFRNEYEGNMGYGLSLYNNKGEAWYLYYGADKKLVYSTYTSN